MPRPSKASREHKEHAPGHLRVTVITISDTKDEGTDESGRILRLGVRSAGHELADYAIVPDETASIRAALDAAARRPVDVIVTNGGTGIARRDVTVEAVERAREAGVAPELAAHVQHVGGPRLVRRDAQDLVGRKSGDVDPGRVGEQPLVVQARHGAHRGSRTRGK